MYQCMYSHLFTTKRGKIDSSLQHVQAEVILHELLLLRLLLLLLLRRRLHLYLLLTGHLLRVHGLARLRQQLLVVGHGALTLL